ncbi:MAG: hypothetical protein KBS68_00320 [Clostridiales bacterium]|nr:hypothetical protein [Candidatus Crickella merdequi]
MVEMEKKQLAAGVLHLEIATLIAVYGCIFFNILNFAADDGFGTYQYVFSTPNLATSVIFLYRTGNDTYRCYNDIERNLGDD